MGVGLLASVASAAQETDASAQSDGIPATAYQTVNVRNGPGTFYDIVGRLSAGDSVIVDGRYEADEQWLHIIMSDGQPGWVGAFVLMLEGEISALPMVSAELDNEVEGGSSGPGADVIVVAYGRVNVRSGPNLTYEVVGQMEVSSEAQAVARSSEDSDWLFVEDVNGDEDFEGWVAYFTVRVTGDTETLPVRVPDDAGELVVPSTLIATRYNARLHTVPTLDSPTVLVVPFDDFVTPLAQTADGQWLYVQYGETEGWGAVELFVISQPQLETIPLYNSNVGAFAAPATPLSSTIEPLTFATPPPGAVG
ncbi:MAG: SH3 domain-containing protein [Burkholderiales bacterium]|nr:SH3 domain-containing protein [Anaerolineae bacterium]